MGEDFGIEDKICPLLQTYDIKRETWVGGGKLNEVNCRRFIEKNEEKIKSLRDILFEMKKGTVSDGNINMYCDQHNKILPRWIMPIVAWEH